MDKMSCYRVTPRAHLSNVTVAEEDGGKTTEEEARCFSAADAELRVGLRAPALTGTPSLLVKHQRRAAKGTATTRASPCSRDTAGQAGSARGNEQRVVPGAAFKERAQREVDELLLSSAAGVLKDSEREYRFHRGEQERSTSRMPGTCRGVVLEGATSCPRGRSRSPQSATGDDTRDLTRAFNASSESSPHNRTPRRKDSWSSRDMRDLADGFGYSCSQERRGEFTQEFLMRKRGAVLHRGKNSALTGLQWWIWALLLLWNTHVLQAQGMGQNYDYILFCHLYWSAVPFILPR